MTIKAELPLTFFVEHLVARGTFILKLEVSGYDLAGHDQRLNILSCRVM